MTPVSDRSPGGTYRSSRIARSTRSRVSERTLSGPLTTRDAVATLTEAIGHCTQAGDFTTRNILEEMVRDEEGHVDWLETQLETIAQVGLENYLTQQIAA